MDKDNLTVVAPENRDLAAPRQVMQALGQKIFQDSIDTGRDFCQLMLILSIGAIFVYLGLIILAVPYDANKGWMNGLALLVPGSLLLLASLIFAVGYLPESVHLTPDTIDHVEKLRLSIIRRRIRLIKLGLLLFAFGVFTSMVAIIKAHL